MSANDYGVSTDYVTCGACGAKRPHHAMAGARPPVCADLGWCLARQRDAKALGAKKKPTKRVRR